MEPRNKHTNIQSQLRGLRRLILVVVGGTAGLAAALLVFLPIDERVRATGNVRAESDTYLYAPEDGTLAKVHAREGERVRMGDPVVSLDSSPHRSRLKEIEADIAKAESDLGLRKAQMEKLLRLPLPREFWHMREQLAMGRERLTQAEVELARSQGLHARGLISAQEMERAELSLEIAKSEAAKTREKLAILEEGLEDTIVKEAVAGILTAEAEIHRLEVAKEICLQSIERCTVRSPGDGVVTRVLKRRAGERVTRGEDLAHLAHGPPTKVDLFAGESNYHRIRPGMRVLLRSQAFDALRHGYIEGTVVQVALEPETQGTDASGAPASNYRVVTRIDHSPQELVIGSTLEGRIILQRIPLWKLLLPQQMRGEPDDIPPGNPPEGLAGEPSK